MGWKETIKAWAVPVLAVVLVVFLAYSGAQQLGWIHGPALSLTGGNVQQPAPASLNAGGASADSVLACKQGGAQPVAQEVAYYLDPNNNNKLTQVATTFALYNAGNPTPLASNTTSASAVITSPTGSLSCGASIREIAGDGSTYYYAETPDFTVDQAVVGLSANKGISVIPTGASTVYVKDSLTNYASTVTFNWTAAGHSSGGTSTSDLMLKVQSPSAPNMMGDLGHAVCFRFNSGNFTSIMANGGKQVSIAHIKPTSTLDTIQCWEFGPIDPKAQQPFQEYSLTVKAGASGPTSGALIDVFDVDKTNELYNGYLVPTENSAAGVLSNGYDTINNPNTGTGRADVNTNSAITVTT